MTKVSNPHSENKGLFQTPFPSSFRRIFLSFFPSSFLSIFLSFYLSIFLSLYLSIFLSFYLSIFLSFYLSIFLQGVQKILPDPFIGTCFYSLLCRRYCTSLHFNAYTVVQLWVIHPEISYDIESSEKLFNLRVRLIFSEHPGDMCEHTGCPVILA